MEKQTARRPLKSRQTAWAKALSRMIAQAGISPNMISFMSMVFAALSLGSALLGHPIFAALFIQMRLICNLMDGMVAVEFGKKSKTGDLWNDVPDRFADVAIILGAGYLSQQYPFAVELAWANGTLAVMTAYLRVLGASLASPHYYIGPMAKPHRMAILTAAFIGEAIYPGGTLLYGALIIMLVGQVITCVRRLNRIAVDLENK
ncbi:CDP-alcohol phosphatidyltransferase family protein [Peredibacter sp. HCB2-198]|uniref:CDP-alcohol phosphatidyltransferase family protein n=1 Tax=Peredibacter sp. HCB2-198 TaxID=3383025 RepID=UPI0038B579C6